MAGRSKGQGGRGIPDSDEGCTPDWKGVGWQESYQRLVTDNLYTS